MKNDKGTLQHSLVNEAFRSCQRMLYHIADDPSIHIGLVMVYWLFDIVQFLAIPFTMEPTYMWKNNNVMRSVMSVLAPIMFVPMGKDAIDIDALPTSSDSLFFAVVTLLIVLWGSFLWGAYYHMQPAVSPLAAAMAGKPINGNGNTGSGNRTVANSLSERDRNGDGSTSSSNLSNSNDIDISAGNLMIPYWFLRFIRSVVFIALHALFIPVTTTLFSPFYCPSKGMWPTSSHPYVCFGSGHLGFFISSIILLPCWITWNCVIAACIINRVPDLTGKRNILCASHGRVFAGIVVLKTLLAGLYIFSPSINPWIYCIVLVLGGLAYTGAYFNYLPYFHQWINQFQLSVGCVFTVSSASLLLAQIVGDPQNYAGVTACLVLVIPAIYIGYALGSLRFRSFSHHGELFSPFTVELRMRYLLFELIGQLGNANEAVTALSRTRATALYEDVPDTMNGNGGGNKKSIASLTRQVHNEEEVTLLRKKDITNLVNNTLNSIDTLYKDAINVFATSAILQVFYAHFLGVYMHNEHLERVYLTLAETRADQLSFDIQFFVQQRRTEILSMVLSIGVQTMTIARRMQFESLQELSRIQVSEVRCLVLNFWSELSNKHPDLQRVQQVGTIINQSMADTKDTFKELLNLAPQSASVMRAYADFLLELANDPARAMELLNDAESLEDERSKVIGMISDAELVFGSIVNEFDLSSESLAWCKVSTDPSKLGVIVDVNPSMLKLFGYNRREMIGREMSFLVPEPIASIHPRIMLRYQSTGKERVVNQNRVLLALHRNGYIFPIKINIRPTAEEIISVFEEIPSNLGFIFFLGAEHDWKVTAACKTSLAAFHFNVSQMKNGTVSMKKFTTLDVSTLIAPLIGSNEPTVITLGEVHISGSLQLTPVAFISTPIYILRYRIVGYTNIDANTSFIKLKDDGLKNDNKGNDDDIEEDVDSDAADRYSGSDNGSDTKERKRNGESHSSTVQSKSKVRDPKDITVNKLSSPTTSSVRPKKPLGFATGHPPIGLGNDISLCPVMGSSTNGSTLNTNTTIHKNDNSGSIRTTKYYGSAPPPIVAVPGQIQANPLPSRWLSPSIDNNNQSGTIDSKLHETMEEITADVALGFDKPSRSTIEKTTTNAGDRKSEHSVLNDTTLVPYSPSNANSSSSILRGMGLTRDSRLLKVNFSGDGTVPTSNTNTVHINSPAVLSRDQLSKPTVNIPPTPSVTIIHENTVPSILHSETRPHPVSTLRTVTNDSSILFADHAVEKINTEEANETYTSSHNLSRNNRTPFRKQNSGKMGGTVISKGSVLTETVVTDLLRKGVAASGAKLERSLKTLRTSIIVVFLIITGLNLISLIITSVLFTDLKNNLVLVSMSGDRGLEINRAIGHIQSLIFSAEKKFVIPEQSSYVRDKLSLWVDKLETLHRELYLSVDKGASAEEIRLYTQPVIKMYDLVPGTYINRTAWQAKERYAGLANAVLEFISKIRSVQALTDDNITHNRAPVWFVMQNGMNELHEAVNQSLMYANKRTLGHVDDIELTNLIVMIIAESVVGIIVLGILIPAVNSVSRTKQHVFNTFLEVPVLIIRALRNRVQKKMESILRAENDEDHGIDIDNMGTDEAENSQNEYSSGVENNSRPPNGKSSHPPGSGNGSVSSSDSSLNRALHAYHLKMQNTLTGVAEHSEDDYEDERKCCGNCCRKSVPQTNLPSSVTDIHKRRRRRTFRNTRSSRATVLLMMILPLLLYVIYFAAIYQWRYLESMGVRNIKAEMLWSKQAELYTGLSNIYLRDAVGYCDPAFVERSLNLTVEANNHLEYLQNGLLYGDDDMLLRPGIHLSRDIYNLAMVDGCFEPNNDAYNLTSCKTDFYDGIFGKGFSQGFREFLYLNREVIQATRAALSNDPSLVTTCNALQALNSDVLNNVDQMRWRYMLAGLAQFTQIRLNLSNARFDSFIVANIMITVCTIFALQIFYSFLYKPMIRSMDKEIKNVRLLLLLFPDEVSRQVPAIIQTGKDLLSDAASVSSGSSG